MPCHSRYHLNEPKHTEDCCHRRGSGCCAVSGECIPVRITGFGHIIIDSVDPQPAPADRPNAAHDSSNHCATGHADRHCYVSAHPPRTAAPTAGPRNPHHNRPQPSKCHPQARPPQPVRLAAPVEEPTATAQEPLATAVPEPTVTAIPEPTATTEPQPTPTVEHLRRRTTNT